jgi:O-antigen ligase
MFNVVWTPIERLIGRGVEIHGVRADSPLTKAIYVENDNEKITLKDGDAVLEVNKKKVRSPEDLLAALEQNEKSTVKFYRPDYYLTVQVKRADLLAGANASERLGFTGWKKSRNWRSMGFYGHWTTYAEVLQLIASLVFGLFIASIRKNGFLTQRRGDTEKKPENESDDKKTKIRNYKSLFKKYFSAFLLFCLAAMLLALLLNVTRASQLAFLVSVISIVLLAGSRKLIFISAVIILPVALGGLLFLQQSRNVGFFDREDDSTKYRQTVYREGFDLWTNNARHFFLGVGMDSIKRYAKDWRLFDDGRLPMGHFHSTPLQLAVERGFPALLLWLWILGVYARTLFRKIQNSEFRIQDSGLKIEDSAFAAENSEFSRDWKTLGVLLGCFGGLIGFFTSGLVHYNLGDAEVAMVFFLLMGIGFRIQD